MPGMARHRLISMIAQVGFDGRANRWLQVPWLIVVQ